MFGMLFFGTYSVMSTILQVAGIVLFVIVRHFVIGLFFYKKRCHWRWDLPAVRSFSKIDHKSTMQTTQRKDCFAIVQWKDTFVNIIQFEKYSHYKEGEYVMTYFGEKFYLVY